MVKYVVKRILIMIPMVLGVMLIFFVLLHSLTASTVRYMPISGDGDALDAVFRFFNAGSNFFTKYLRYCYNVFVHFDFGRSLSTRFPIRPMLTQRLQMTLILLTTGAGATFIIGIPLGIYTATKKDSLMDRIINIVSLIFSSIPNYAIAMMVALLLAVYLRVVPVISRYMSPQMFLMPVLTITLGGVSSIARMTRTSMLEALNQPYTTALRSKGLKERRVVYVHALKNAMVPIISVANVFLAQMICGTLVVESFFNIPGLGSYMLRSVGTRDHFEILGSGVLMTILLAGINILADIAYALVNPQIKIRYTRSRNKLRKEAAE